LTVLAERRLTPLPPVTGPLSSATGPAGSVVVVVAGAAVVPGPAVVGDVAGFDPDEHAASTRTPAAHAAVAVRRLFPFIRGIPRR
jgi:hypothetical protein